MRFIELFDQSSQRRRLEQGCGALAGEVAAQVAQRVLDLKIGRDATQLAETAAGKAGGMSLDSQLPAPW